MTSSDAEKDSKPNIIIIIRVSKIVNGINFNIVL